jgi:hypothetical protein
MPTNTVLMIFSILLFVIGASLIALVYKCQTTLDPKCTSSSLELGLNLMLTIGVMLVTLPIVQFICYSGCQMDQNHLPYRKILLLLFGVLMIAQCLIFSGLSKSGCDDTNTKNISIGVFIVSILFFGFIGWTFTESFTSRFGKINIGTGTDQIHSQLLARNRALKAGAKAPQPPPPNISKQEIIKPVYVPNSDNNTPPSATNPFLGNLLNNNISTSGISD